MVIKDRSYKGVWEIDYEHIDEQPHRSDCEAIEETSKKHNVKKQVIYCRFLASNPGYNTRLNQMTDDYILHMHKMIKNHSTWDGVPEELKATHLVDGVLAAMETWEQQPLAS